MNRLTEKIGQDKPRTFKGLIRWFVTHNGIRKDEIVNEYNEIYDRLSEYEATGLEPEQIIEIDKLYLKKCEGVNKLLAELREQKEGE